MYSALGYDVLRVLEIPGTIAESLRYDGLKSPSGVVHCIHNIYIASPELVSRKMPTQDDRVCYLADMDCSFDARYRDGVPFGRKP